VSRNRFRDFLADPDSRSFSRFLNTNSNIGRSKYDTKVSEEIGQAEAEQHVVRGEQLPLERGLRKEKRLAVSAFPSVCPEPVLANMTVFGVNACCYETMAPKSRVYTYIYIYIYICMYIHKFISAP
jgi:hypothetical protein